jgi:hypothetical protein
MQTSLSMFRAQHRSIAGTGGGGPEDDGTAALRPLCAFCAIGLLLGCILSMLTLQAGLASLVLPLILLSAPLAALLGLALGTRD